MAQILAIKVFGLTDGVDAAACHPEYACVAPDKNSVAIRACVAPDQNSVTIRACVAPDQNSVAVQMEPRVSRSGTKPGEEGAWRIRHVGACGQSGRQFLAGVSPVDSSGCHLHGCMLKNTTQTHTIYVVRQLAYSTELLHRAGQLESQQLPPPTMNQEEDLVDNSHDEQEKEWQKILECGSKSQRLSILQFFGCHVTGLSLLLIERRRVTICIARLKK
ncbi:hypothetical protein NC651_036339 [Populus alba x Populus x berolinensis]|nr:hypothetical protein NC651_036339 [Populus alba x Populus x berolinensis]